MATASSLLYEEQLLCSICLDAFNEPVSTPCGHNYCKSCITGYWASTDLIHCPLCKKKFRKRPQLQVNTEFRDMVEQFNNMKVRGEDDIPAKPGEVPCDICLEPKRKAQKTCLVCLASYCQTHLEPHQRVPTLKKHQLIGPVSNLEDRVCKKHDKMFEFFCYADQACICSMCLKDGHATHEAVPLEHAFRERKAQVDYMMSEIKVMENTKSRSIKEIEYLVEQNKRRSEKEIADISDIFTALLVSLQRSQAELIEVIQEKQKAARKEAEDHLTKLEQEVAELRRKRFEVEQLLQTDDHFSLLQSWLSLSHTEGIFDPLSHSIPPSTPDFSDMNQQSYVGMVKKAVAQMEKIASNEMEMLIHEVRLSDGCEATEQPDAVEERTTDEFVREVWTPPQDKLMMIQQCHAVDVTLDSYMAHSSLVVSKDGKQLRFGEGLLHFFTSLFWARPAGQPLVLGKEGFSSGRFYYEVQVSGSKGWVLGVVKEPIIKEKGFTPTLKDGGWTLCGVYNEFKEECFANSDRSSLVYLGQRPQTVGVFVDYEKGEISFYDVDARTLIHSQTGCAFIENPSAFKAFLHYMTGTSSNNRRKLYPVFGFTNDDSDNMLKITPVVCAT
ncbi:E3 ubiquitin-protein ligase TRIM39-like isoform X1 [Epinephelus fuscoguttatus]|uniref:E3 ubiquitin-protein ligase TRIM39-like isoform X1 n=1 Tax=Epinephelus fuscoguttatus TaxID=293821 RepID=UPI0020D0E596|nr:E3 ubiquitin-protein ligase TRIM39-like isoform X1 [Epinephelus fuscoguttatus]